MTQSLQRVDTAPLTVSICENLIGTAFHGVTLGRGISLRQAQIIDRHGEGVSAREFAELPRHEVTEDWSCVPLTELDRNCVSHLDAAGFRYYIPALMLSVIEHYDAGSMRVIGTLGSLYPKQEMWRYHMNMYSMLDRGQCAAIAGFLAALPSMVRLDREHQAAVLRALRNYWQQFLQR